MVSAKGQNKVLKAFFIHRNDIPILYQDENILVINKPAGISVIPERYDSGETSLLELLGEEAFLRPVHRIDKETSGIVLFARSEESFRHLSIQFQNHTLRKVYHALIMGRPSWQETVCEAPLLADGDRKHRTVVRKEGKSSCTRFRVLETFRGYSLLEAVPETGRTHQIRAHLNYIHHPLVGDTLYGGKELYLSDFKKDYKSAPSPKGIFGGKPGGGERGVGEKPLLARVALHAKALECVHPERGGLIQFEAPYPKDLEVALKQLRKYAGV
ncbi:MAG: pseudouridine synthase [Spirochaetales bacterium]